MIHHTATQHLTYAKKIAVLLDSQFKVFGVRVGLDPVLGLIPGVGEVLSILFSFYLLWIGLLMNLPMGKLLLMVVNIVIDSFLGVVPILGDLADVAFRSNLRNLKILEDHKQNDSTVIDGEVIS